MSETPREWAARVAATLGPGWRVTHGWHLSGSGPARFGWAGISPAGGVRWLGRASGASIGATDRDRDDAHEALLQVDVCPGCGLPDLPADGLCRRSSCTDETGAPVACGCAGCTRARSKRAQ